MNEFLAQFLIEARELVEQATADLLALEKSPDDKERLDSAFRAFHTLKGGAGIVDFAAMEIAVHAAEDLLSGVRSHTRQATTQLIDDCLVCLDQVSRWLDSIERTGDLPVHAEAQAAADTFVERLDHASERPPASAEAAPSPTSEWVQDLLARFATLRPTAHTAVRYAPSTDCFFNGEDPLARLEALPGLLCVEATPASPWPTLDTLDPFSCNLVLFALSSASCAEVLAALGDAAGRCSVQPLIADVFTDEAPALSSPAREVLQAQIALLEESTVVGSAGRMASAGIVAANVLRNAGDDAAAERLTRILEASLAENAPARLRDAIEAVLNATSPRAAASSEARAPTFDSAEPETRATTLRIDASRIDALVTLTGELTVAKNAIGHLVELSRTADHEFPALLAKRHAFLDRQVRELQRLVVGLRVLPLRHVTQRLPRLLREISADLGKPAELIVQGEETEADKAIVEMLFEPLLHVLRNAVDHGIENQATRLAMGKRPVAAIRLSANREGEHVVVEVSDDGAGIDVERVREVALERNLVTQESLVAMSDEQVVDLIFDPGFSTAKVVTGLSGRGVGMDVVRSAMDRMGGHVTVKSQAGHGTTVRFTLPFSVIMTRVMVVGAGEQLFGIPLDAVVETGRVSADKITQIGSAHAVVVRNRTLPLVELTQVLGLAPNANEEAEATIVVTRIDGQHCALRVDRIGARMDVMLKPLEGLLAGTPGIGGSTVLGDGSVLLVLAPAELFH